RLFSPSTSRLPPAAVSFFVCRDRSREPTLPEMVHTRSSGLASWMRSFADLFCCSVAEIARRDRESAATVRAYALDHGELPNSGDALAAGWPAYPRAVR